MTAATISTTKIGVVGELKIGLFVTDALAMTGFTLDLNSDVADGRGAVFKKITNTVLQAADGADKTGTFDSATGIYTAGTITTGVHSLLVIGY